jgi:hypothetical protein
MSELYDVTPSELDDRRWPDFSHLSAEQHEEMRQNDMTGEHGEWEDREAEKEEALAEGEVERCECGVVSRGLIDGRCADCRDRADQLPPPMGQESAAHRRPA